MSELACAYSDAYKDLYGFRPQNIPSDRAELKSLYDQLCDSLNREFEESREHHQALAREYNLSEKEVRSCLSFVRCIKQDRDICGDRTRKTTLGGNHDFYSWMEASQCQL